MASAARRDVSGAARRAAGPPPVGALTAPEGTPGHHETMRPERLKPGTACNPADCPIAASPLRRRPWPGCGPLATSIGASASGCAIGSAAGARPWGQHCVAGRRGPVAGVGSQSSSRRGILGPCRLSRTAFSGVGLAQRTSSAGQDRAASTAGPMPDRAPMIPRTARRDYREGPAAPGAQSRSRVSRTWRISRRTSLRTFLVIRSPSTP